MNISRAMVVASVSALLVSGAGGLAQANDAHHPGAKATTNHVIKKKPRTSKGSASFQSGSSREGARHGMA